MIVCVTIKEINERTGREELLVSHGIDYHTGKNVILPCECPSVMGAVWHPALNEYVLLEKNETL